MKTGTRPRRRRGKEAALLPSRAKATGPVYRVVLIRDGRYLPRRRKARPEGPTG